jgi:calcineurin-like phosphoesterase family protein
MMLPSITSSVSSTEKTNKMIARYLKDGWQSIHDFWSLTLKNGQEVHMSHFPYDIEYDARYKDRRPLDQGHMLLHGHLHGKYRKKNNMIDVAFDAELKLLSENDIINLINDTRQFIPTRLTEFYKQRHDDI